MSALRAATWTLEVPAAHPNPESKTETDRNHSEESILGEDFREVANLSDIQDGGKYRSIVKIQSRFNGTDGEDVWMMGTGWLIRPDLLVTAGHVVYDKAYGCGAATQIKCYVGYNGVQSVPKKGSTVEGIPAVQPRYGSKVVTTESWIKNSDARPHDVAFIKVHKEFTGKLNVFKFTNTISPATVRLGVVGYPGDKDLNGEKGAQMYELFDRTAVDLVKHPRHMISYKVSTYGGQSGAPILSKPATGEMIAIGTHCYGAGNGELTNSGNSIGGKWGNDYNSFISLFGSQESTFPTKPNDIVYVTPGKPPVPGPQPPIPAPHPSLPSDVEEGFLDVLKSVARIGATAVQVGGSLFGPIGTIVGTAAGGLLGAIAGQESTIEAVGKRGGDPIAPGVAEHAVLAEASLQAVISLFNHSDRDDPVVNKVLAHMSHNYTRFAPNVDDLATRLAPQLTECALDIVSQRLDRAMTEPRQESVPESLPRKALTGLPTTEGGIGNQGAFAEGLLGDTSPLPGGEEGAFDFLGPLIGKALLAAKPLVSRAAKAVVTDLLPKVVAQVIGGNAESKLSPVSPRNAEAARLIFQRALVADTAVSAFASLSSSELAALKIRLPAQNNSQQQQEGVFDFIKTTMQKIGPFALNAAKGAIKHFAPVLIDVAAIDIKKRLRDGDASSNAAAVNGTVTESNASLGVEPRLKRQPSNLDRYHTGLAADTINGDIKTAPFVGDLVRGATPEPSGVAVSPAVSYLVSRSVGGGFARAAGPANGLSLAASGAGLLPAGALARPQPTEPQNPDQPPIITHPTPEFDP
ncbi:ATP synthase F1 [Mycena rebaudengoi]|nr:ATP synthase F1 [Mycena rebaudengoi]